MEEGEERSEDIASAEEAAGMIENYNRKCDAAAERYRIVRLFEIFRDFFEEIGSGFVDVGHDKLLSPRETRSPPLPRRESAISSDSKAVGRLFPEPGGIKWAAGSAAPDRRARI